MGNAELEPNRGATNDHVAVRPSRRAVLRGGLGAAGAGVLTVGGGRTFPAFTRTARAPGSSSAEAPAPSPDSITVCPHPETRTASPGTEISFRDFPPDALGTVSVVGDQSGGHTGLLVAHATGRGASFVPDAPFRAGETVTVRAGRALGTSADGSISFTVARPVEPRESPASRAADHPKTAPQAFRSRPDLLPPVIDVTTPAEGTADGYVVAGAKPPDGQNGVMIFDNRGELVWFAPMAVDVATINDVRVQWYQGQPVLTWWEGVSAKGWGYGHYVVRDGAYREIATLRVGNGYNGGDLHEFLLTPEGTALIIVYNPVRWDLSPVGGDADGRAMDGVVQELDVVTGRVLFEWHSLDHIALEESFEELPEDNGEAYDYVHLNAIDVDRDGNLIVCARHTWTVYKIDRRTGQIIWRLNGKRGDFTMGEGAEFAFQHDARVQPNGDLTLFDNAAKDPDADARSRGVVLKLDTAALTATLVREYIHPTDVLGIAQGNVQMLANGNAIVGWGSAPVLSEFNAGRNICFNARFPTDVTTYRAYRFPWTGRPTDAPAIAAEPMADTAVTVYASWNGATEVAGWDILAGPDPDRLRRVGSAPRAGFETAITVKTSETFLAAQAKDGMGKVLGTSEPIRPGD